MVTPRGATSKPATQEEGQSGTFNWKKLNLYVF
jgi:hypothetical protein